MNPLRLLVFYLTVTGCFGRKWLFIVLFSRDSVWNIFIRVGIYFRDSLYLCGIIKSISMKLTHGYYHLIAILTVAIWGLTFIATKVLINHGLTPQEIFFYRFLIAYIGIWAISPKHLFADNLKDELWSSQKIQLWGLPKPPMLLSSFARLLCWLRFFPCSFIRVRRLRKGWSMVRCWPWLA